MAGVLAFVDFDLERFLDSGPLAELESRRPFTILSFVFETILALAYSSGCIVLDKLLCLPFCDSEVFSILIFAVCLRPVEVSRGENFLWRLFDSLRFLDSRSRDWLAFWLPAFLAPKSETFSYILSIKFLTDRDVLESIGEKVL